MSYKEKKNEIIIKEIQHWKQSKLLPETYCDFLLALYTKGDGSAHQIKHGSGTSMRDWLKLIILILLVPIILGVYLYINSVTQIGILLILGIVGFSLYNSHKKNEGFLRHLSLVVFLFIGLLLTISISKFLFEIQHIINGVILLNFISWLILSLKNKYTYLTILSSLAILFMVIYIVL